MGIILIPNFDKRDTIMRSPSMNLVVVLLIAVILTACAHRQYYAYNNVKYDSPEQALAAQKRACTARLNEIAPLPEYLDETAIVILPSSSLIVENGITKRGHLSLEAVDFLLETSENGHMCMAESIQKRRIFKSVRIVRSDKPEDTVFMEDVAVYLAMPGPGLAQWYVKKKNEIKAVPVNWDRGLATAEQRILSWLEDVEKAAKLFCQLCR
jgi:hypothetical protein